VIHYHGTPISGNGIDAGRFLKGRHAFISFAAPAQIELVADLCQSFALDNGAFSAWRQGRAYDFDGFREWASEWVIHPGCDWVVIPDVIDGTERDNDELIATWTLDPARSVPVWHLHESLGRLLRLCLGWPRVALGSSGEWSDPGAVSWWKRMDEAIAHITRASGSPPCKLHGLRMLDPDVFQYLPLSSADSTNVARNCGIDSKWRHANSPHSKHLRAEIIADRIESYNSAPTWEGPPIPIDQKHNYSLFAETEA
jgi:hypothetical protein